MHTRPAISLLLPQALLQIESTQAGRTILHDFSHTRTSRFQGASLPSIRPLLLSHIFNPQTTATTAMSQNTSLPALIPRLRRHRANGPYNLNALSRVLYPQGCHLAPRLELVPLALASANTFLCKVIFYPLSSSPLAASASTYATEGLRNILRQIEQKAQEPIGKLGIFAEIELPRELEELHSQMMWLVIAFLEEGCGFRVMVTLDHERARLRVQFPYRVGVCGGGTCGGVKK